MPTYNVDKRGTMRIATDAVVFTIKHDELQILLIKRKKEPFKDMYALPGGFVNAEENLEDAAKRELGEETGVKNIFLRMLGTYGAVDRDPRGRIISVSFIALINADQKLNPATDAAAAEWHDIDNIPKLAFDHDKIIKDALEQLRFEIQTTNIAVQILPKKFTLAQMQQLYEQVLGKKLDKRNFRKKIHELEILRETNETMMEGAHRPAMLYEFASKTYKSIRNKMHIFLK